MPSTLRQSADRAQTGHTVVGHAVPLKTSNKASYSTGTNGMAWTANDNARKIAMRPDHKNSTFFPVHFDEHF
jgi:hypothetical protein